MGGKVTPRFRDIGQDERQQNIGEPGLSGHPLPDDRTAGTAQRQGPEVVHNPGGCRQIFDVDNDGSPQPAARIV